MPSLGPKNPIIEKVLDERAEHELQELVNAASTKASNPKDALAVNKLPLSLWPVSATIAGTLGLLDGASKYGRLNWRHAGVRASVYMDAALRHLYAWFEGEDVAPDSGVSHLGHVLACVAILLDAQQAGKLLDDRNFAGTSVRQLVEAMTPHVARIRKLHADKHPHHFSLLDTDVGDGNAEV